MAPRRNLERITGLHRHAVLLVSHSFWVQTTNFCFGLVVFFFLCLFICFPIFLYARKLISVHAAALYQASNFPERSEWPKIFFSFGAFQNPRWLVEKNKKKDYLKRWHKQGGQIWLVQGLHLLRCIYKVLWKQTADIYHKQIWTNK